MQFNTEININLFAPVYYVSDRKAMIDYYENLGFFYDNSSGVLINDGFNFFFKQSQPGNASIPNEMVYGNKAIDTIVYVRGINTIYEAYKRSGAIIYQPITINENNCKQFFIKDPGGFITKFIQTVSDSNPPKIFFSTKVFYVSNLKQTLEYYNALGFTCNYVTGLVFRDDIKIIFIEVSQADKFYSDSAEFYDIYAGIEFGLTTLYQELKDSNAKFVHHLMQDTDEKKEFCIKDPDGHKILFIDF